MKQLEKYEPDVFKLFRSIKDGERVETAQYSYRLRDSGRFGISVTRWTKDQQQTQPQQVIDTGANVRKVLAESQQQPPQLSDKAEESKTRILASIIEMRKLAATLAAGLELLQGRIERQ